jgi:methionyl-tRNA synthetase
MKDSGKFYVTTSIAYVNAKPHIGFAMEVIQADVLARYHRLLGDDTFFMTGTDEHGMKLEQTAKEQGKTPQALVDENSAYFRDLEKLLNLSNDHFIRTTDDLHLKGAQQIWKKLVEAGDIYKGSYEGLYCVGCESFKTEKEIVDGVCPLHNRPLEKIKEENYFFKLSKYSDEIKKRILDGQLVILPDARKHEILSVLEEGLKDVSFSRPKKVLEWGIEVPDDPGQVMYVWCDALSNYITGVGYGNDEKKFEKYWPADVHLIGKDILRFHSAIWIGMLLSAGIRLPRAIYVHGFITSEGMKMSKSLNNVVDPVGVVEKYGADPLRYFLLKEIPTMDDGDFSKERFKTVYESELADTYGNLVSRVLAMTHKYFDGKVPEVKKEQVVSFADQQARFWKDYDAYVKDFNLKVALETVVLYATNANQYVEANKPWALAKTDQTKLAEVLYVLLEMIRQTTLALLPFIPATSQKVFHYLGQGEVPVYGDARTWGALQTGTQLQKAEPLFPKVDLQPGETA